MIRKVLVLLTAASAVIAHAEVSPYISVSGGYGGIIDADTVKVTGGTTDNGSMTFNSGGVIEGAFGLKFDQGLGIWPIRAEAAVFYQMNEVDTMSDSTGATTEVNNTDLEIAALMGNVYLDILTGSFVSPYVMAGIGGANVNFAEDGADNKNDSIVLYQIGAGVAFNFSKHWSADIKVKYFGGDDYKYVNGNDSTTVDISGVQAQAGFKVVF